MKKLIFSISVSFMFSINIGHAQINKKDTVMLDTTKVEKIKRMPMDSTYYKMPVAPFNPKDTVYRKSGDDEDPKRFDQPK